MGNLLPNGTGGRWRFNRDASVGGDDYSRVKSYYSGDTPQQIRITGPLALDITLEVDNAEIEVTGDGHRICLIGQDNSVNVIGSRTALRIEGATNKLKGYGQHVVVYTDNQVILEELTLDATMPLADRDAPEKLDLLESHLDIPSGLANPALIRCTYVPLPQDGKGDGDNNNLGGSDDKKGAADSNQFGDDDIGNGNNARHGPSPNDPNDNLSNKRQVGDDENDQASNKKLKGDPMDVDPSPAQL